HPYRQTGVREIAVVPLVDEAVGTTHILDQLPARDQEGEEVKVTEPGRRVVGVDTPRAARREDAIVDFGQDIDAGSQPGEPAARAIVERLDVGISPGTGRARVVHRTPL